MDSPQSTMMGRNVLSYVDFNLEDRRPRAAPSITHRNLQSQSEFEFWGRLLVFLSFALSDMLRSIGWIDPVQT